jgi:hypothetical protein
MKHRLALRLVIAGVLGGLLVTFLVPFIFPWSRLNCWTESIDITCGRYRYERYLFFVKWTDSVEDTALSRLHRDLIGEPSEPVWRRVNTFSPGVRHSPHYIHHGSLHAAKRLTSAFDQASFRSDAQKKAIETFFRLLQEDDRDFRASNYAISIWELAASTESDIEIAREDLPEPPSRS